MSDRMNADVLSHEWVRHKCGEGYNLLNRKAKTFKPLTGNPPWKMG